MTNISITTHPTGRSPENKYFFGKKTRFLDINIFVGFNEFSLRIPNQNVEKIFYKKEETV